MVVVGSGIVGATAALSLAKQTSLKIAVLDANSPVIYQQNEKYDFRVSAISLASKRIFENLQVWSAILAKRCSAYSHMQVWQDRAEINFAAADVNEKMLGYIIEDNVMRQSLYEAFANYDNLHFLHPVKLSELQEKNDGIDLQTEHGNISAKLVIAADGANSWVREQINVSLKTWDYQHTAIVTTVKTELPHKATARQHFLRTGPLAFLPLQDQNSSSIVWSVPPAEADALLALSDEDFQKALSVAFDYKLGAVTAVERRYHFPLIMRHAKNYVQSRIALIGDAAHTIHPLAGQGVNLGLLDAASLSEVIADACQKNRDFSSLATLRRYERWRKGDNLAMLAMVEVMKRLFVNEHKAVRSIRQMGLNLTDQLGSLKNILASYALGKRSDLPAICRVD